MFDYDTKEKEHQNTCTNQIASCFGALSLTYTLSHLISVLKTNFTLRNKRSKQGMDSMIY
jgi:hypothetical protein